MGVSPKGSGKTPAGKLFLGALMAMEREEKEAFDDEKELDRKKNMHKRKYNDSASKNKELDDDSFDETEEVDEPKLDGDKVIRLTRSVKSMEPSKESAEEKDGLKKKNKKRKLNRSLKEAGSETLRRIKQTKSFDLENETDEEEDEEVEKPRDEHSPQSTKGNGEGAEQFMFHKKTRLADSITPEALLLSLHHGSGNLILKSDEYKVVL